jgi:hypothetical protein
MKKVLQIGAALGFGVIALTSTASAAQSCVIDTTGPSSVNVCTNTETVTCNVVNTTTITVNGSNYQVSDTGDATVEGNTNGGGAGSGSSDNSNSSSVNIQVVNNNPDGSDLCTVVTTTRTAVETPAAGGSGAVTPAPVKVAALPNTSGKSPLAVAGIVTGVLAAVAVLARGASFAYGRIKG